jgi:hypothetical protein
MIPITDIIDTKGYTILHMATFKGSEDISLYILSKAKE